MRVLIVEQGKPPQEANIANELQALQAAVGGYIETLDMGDNVVLVCDEDGISKGYAWNRYISNDCIIRGTFFLCGVDDETLQISQTHRLSTTVTDSISRKSLSRHPRAS